MMRAPGAVARMAASAGGDVYKRQELMKGSKESLKAQGLLSLTIQGVNVTAISGQPARHL